ncbi:snare protein YKT6 [Armillaria luteobubalina]|uniref:Snare protein YKT6 n=1 Tax=Armillaria luteobubalina TaxID=153913 RepID=A0AA39PTC9_9AGAR|nr:snare protein YKT6 [Armillaria luteobubalina]
MEVISTSVIPTPPSKKTIVLSGANDLSSCSFYQKVSRTAQGQRKSIQENNDTARSSSISSFGVIIADQEYPVRPASSLLSKLLDDFTAKVSQPSLSDPSSISFPDINIFLQDPRWADTIMRVRQELDETKIHKSIESVLQRGEKLDNLVDRSSALSAQSKMFYKTTKKKNCCGIM